MFICGLPPPQSKIPGYAYRHLRRSFEEFEGAFTLNATKALRSKGWQLSLMLTSLAQNRPTARQQFCLSEVKEPVAKFATG